MSKGGKAPQAPDYAALARQQGQLNTDAARLAATLNRVNTRGPTGSTTYTQEGDRWTQTTELSPELQALYGGATQRAIGGLGQPVSVAGQPERVSSVTPTAYRSEIAAPDFSGLPEIYKDFSAERQRVEDALYGSATKRLDPQFAQSEESLRARLLNSGIREGSDAWNNEMQRAAWERQDAYADARDRAVAAAGAEQSRLFADALARRQQGVGETQQQFANELARTGLYNDVQDRTFAQGFTNAQLANQTRDAGINEALLLRNQPLQELLQIYGIAAGAGAPAVPQVAGPVPTDIYGAGLDQYNAALEQWNARQARNSNLWNNLLMGGATLGAAAISDRRLKQDIVRVGEAHGLPLYQFRYTFDPSEVHVGVMSDDVRRVRPDAVIVGPDGYDRVDYAALGITFQ